MQHYRPPPPPPLPRRSPTQQRSPRSLSARVARSARDLAGASLTGGAGMEGSLRGLGGGVKGGAGVSSGAGARAAKAPVEDRVAGSRASGRGRSEGLRSAPPMEGEEGDFGKGEFEEFWGGSGLEATSSSRPESGAMEIDQMPGSSRKEPSQYWNAPPTTDNAFIWDDTYLLRTQSGSTKAETPTQDTHTRSDVWHDSTARHDGEQAERHATSIAAERLDLLEKHLAATSLRADFHAAQRSGELVDFGAPQVEKRWWQNPANMRPHAHQMHPQQHLNHHEIQPLAQNSAPPAQEGSAEEVSSSRQYFHCPYVACHQNLISQNTRASADMQRRPCVHAGCNLVLTTANEWLDHVSAAHHNLLQAEDTDEEREREAEAKTEHDADVEMEQESDDDEDDDEDDDVYEEGMDDQVHYHRVTAEPQAHDQREDDEGRMEAPRSPFTADIAAATEPKHSLTDYQMQLMLLENQNTMRKIMAKRLSDRWPPAAERWAEHREAGQEA